MREFTLYIRLYYNNLVILISSLFKTVSEAVYHEYDSLKTRYEVETETMAQAFSRATEVSKYFFY